MRRIYKYRRPFSIFLLILLFSNMLSPFAAYGLTGGPSQPEVQSFEPANTDQMVDPFSGDFVYNVPLMDIGGYPVNISYHSGITMDQEASWAGLGWNINPGAITRNMRGLPDDFMGDSITKEYNINPDWTAGVNLGVGIKFSAVPIGVNVGMGIYYNNYRGVGFTSSIGFNYSPTIASGPNTGDLSASIGTSISFDSQNGIGISPSIGLSQENKSVDGAESSTNSISAGLSFNSRAGVTALTMSANNSQSVKSADGLASLSTGSLGVSSSISFASSAVSPSIEFPMNNFALTAKLDIGGEIPIVAGDISGSISGDYSQQYLLYNTDALRSYGYLYMDQAHQDARALLDYNREKDQPFRLPNRALNDDGTPVLPIPNYDYDLFSVAGQGIAGQYRLQRTDIGSVYDHKVDYVGGSGNVDVDVAIGGFVRVSGNLDAVINNTFTGQWVNNNELYNDLTFRSYNNTDYEPASFVNIGEKTIADQDLYDGYGGDDPFLVKLGSIPFARQATKTIQTFHGGRPNPNGNKYLNVFKRGKRDKRNQAVSYLTAHEGTIGALDTAILNYPENAYPINICNGLTPPVQVINRMAQANGKGHHLSEMTVLGTDGRRYVYGIPAYNRVHRDVTFNVDAGVGDVETGLANYAALTQPPYNYQQPNSMANNIGMDHYFSAQNTPDYSHSFLLTAVLSADYVDLTGNGPSDDDFGDYIRINYTRLYPSGDPSSAGQLYNWRVPYQGGMANYQQGYKSYPCNAKGNYTYGSKEVWYVNSIESKTMIAEFHLSNREDAVGAKDENGGMGRPAARLKKLDRIDLFSKPDIGRNGSAAIPIKSVFFEYDYSLCPNVDNNTGNAVDINGNSLPPNSVSNNVNLAKGKLTLKKIYFTYQNNTKGRLNPYTFQYNNINPPYHQKHYDRWGNYKSNQEYWANNLHQSNYVVDPEYPYTIQDSSYTNKAAAGWSLSQINLPTGGTINVKLESDQYAYVQNLPAMQMFQIAGLGADSSDGIGTAFYTSALPAYQKRCLFIKVGSPITSSSHNAIIDEINNKYIHGINNLYYRCSIKMISGDADNQAEYVPGYCKIAGFGLHNKDTIWIQLQGVPYAKSGPLTLNPICKNAMQFLRLNLPSRAFPGSNTLNDCGSAPPTAIDIIKALIAPIYDIENMFLGYSTACEVDNRCRDIVPNQSWVRLDNAIGNKLGGGARVKQVTITDSWDKMVAGESPASYGQVYSYTMPGPNNTVISSGVAEYEPMVGNDENPFRQPLFFATDAVLAPNNNLYMEYPLCESFYPGAGVGYRQVTITSFGSSQQSSPERKTGYTIKKFYTAYDFPVVTDNTTIDSKLDKFNVPVIGAMLDCPNIKNYTGSQGFSIQLNDMHGKPMSEEVYNNDSSIISRTSYAYKTLDPNAPVKKLDNNVSVMHRDGSVSTAEVGRNVDINFDFRHESTQTYNIGLNISCDVDAIFVPFPVPIPIPVVLPMFGTVLTQFESVSDMKVVRRYGILESVTAQQYGSTVTTTNKVFDSETGEVLLKQTQNEFNDPVYSFTYPAHFAYDGMGPAAININAQYTGVVIQNGLIQNMTGINKYFTAGDEVLAMYSDTIQKLWVIDPNSVNSSAAHQITFIDQNGHAFNRTQALSRIKIIRSGHRNMQSEAIGTLSSLQDPTSGGSLNPTLSTQILNTDITQYKDQWKINCNQLAETECDTCSKIDCHCMHELLSQVIEHHLWSKKTTDSAFVTLCCLDHCGYPDGTPSGPSACKNQYNKITAYSPSVYQAYVGNYLLTIYPDPANPFGLGYPNIDTNSLQLLRTTDLIAVNDSCWNVCDFFTTNQVYYVPAVVSGQPVVPYFASLQRIPTCKQICINLPNNDTINPYRYGMLGNWRPFDKAVYRGFRTPGVLVATVDTPGIRHNGIFDSYSQFWLADPVHKKFVANPTPASNYVNASTITKYNIKGAEIENYDAAGIYSSALYGYLQTLAVGVAKNARYKNIANDNFEDYDFTTDCNMPCRSDHFSFRQSLYADSPAIAAVIDTSTAHTGYRSLKVLGSGAGTSVVQRDIIPDTENPYLVFDYVHNCYLMQSSECLPLFAPDSGKYYVSVWVKEPQNCNVLTYTNSSLKISFAGSPLIYTFTPHGNVIDGWQKIDSVFIIPASATRIFVALNALHGVDVNFDDIRIEPFNSEMKTYVYDNRTTRLMAQMDENNFATFYEYDDRGTPVRLKKETDRGIMTIQETRSTLKAK